MSVPASVLDISLEHTETHVRVPVSSWVDAAERARVAGFTYFCFLSGIDWLPNPALDGEHEFDRDRKPVEPPEVIVDPAVRIAGGTSRFSLLAVLEDVESRTALTLTADVPEDLHVPTWTSVFPGANWHERETWEMFGFVFDGHPRLAHIYLPDEFVGFPLRKDFALPARLVRPWPGLVDMEEMPPAEPSDEAEVQS